jgi:predicted permease
VTVHEESPAEVFEIVGVMPAAFFFPRGAAYWTPAAPRLASMARHQVQQMAENFDRLGVFYGLGRLRPAATLSGTRAEAALFVRAEGEAFKVDLTDLQLVVTPIVDHIFGRARPALVVLMGAVLTVLLIACVNVAGLLFARGASRTREIAVRAALGAGRGVLIRQLLMESAVVALSGAIVGVSAAALALDTLIALSPADIPRLDTTALDSRVLLFAVVIAAATTLVVGLAPARRLSRPSLVDDLKGSATGIAGRSGRAGMGRALVALQVAATVVLLVAAGLCVRSFERLADLDLGFDPRNVLTFRIGGLDETRYTDRAQRSAVVEQLLSRFERAPHVIAAGAVLERPFEHGPIGWDTGLLLEGQPDTPQSWSRNPMLNWEAVTSEYFRSMGIRLVRGRIFNRTDNESSPRVVIVSEALAARVWPGQDPIGKRLRDSFGPKESEHQPPRWQTVVGVVATARYREIESPRLDLYLPHRQSSSDVQHFVVRTAIDPLAVASTVGAEIAAFDTALSMSGVTTMEAIVGRTRGPWRFNMLVFGMFGAVALTLAAMGLFGLVAHGVNRRTREIGVRMALGAERRSVVRLMVRQHGLEPTAVGLIVGLFASVFATRVLAGLLFGISPTDPATFAGVFALLVVAAALASYLSARRAASVDPLVVLRNE